MCAKINPTFLYEDEISTKQLLNRNQTDLMLSHMACKTNQLTGFFVIETLILSGSTAVEVVRRIEVVAISKNVFKVSHDDMNKNQILLNVVKKYTKMIYNASKNSRKGKA